MGVQALVADMVGRAFDSRGLVFTGDAEGNFIALDASSGKPLWHFQMGGAVYASPMTYSVDGKQQIAIAAGSAIYAFGLN